MTPDTAAAIAADVPCTCTDVRFTYATTHSAHCARAVAPEALQAILEAAAPHIRADERRRFAAELLQIADQLRKDCP